MARQRKTSPKSSGGRGSKEAIEKRRAARQLNAVLTGGAKPGDKLDGRTEKRRQRLIKELKEGRRGQALSPIDFVSHVNELLDLGETLASLRKQGVKPRKTEQTPEVMQIVRQTQEAYGFRPDAWRLLGISVPAQERSKGGASKKARKKGSTKSRRKAR
ncbi:MAG: hypothetical protein ACOCXM_09175 [Myxococcota bacterium]